MMKEGLGATKRDYLVVNWFNIINYGASTSASAADNTTAINAAIAAADVVDGTVYIPAGTYNVNTITYANRVSIKGDGTNSSILKSASAVPLIQLTGSSLASGSGKIEDIRLNGDNVGTIGIEWYGVAYFQINRVVMTSFEDSCVKFYGCLIGDFNFCSFWYSPNGVVATHISNPSELPANKIKFNSCSWGYIDNAAIDFSYGAQLILRNCDIENCGQENSSGEGVVYIHDAVRYGEGVAVVIEALWSEAIHNKFIKIDNPYGGNTNYKISNSILQFSSANGTYGIYVTANSTYANKLIIENTTIVSWGTKDIVADGAKASIVYTDSNIGTTSELNSGSIIEDTHGKSVVDINDQTGTTYTLAVSDAGKAVRCANANPITVTVPKNATVAIPVNTVIHVAQSGAGQVTIAPVDGDVTINKFGGLKTGGKYWYITLIKVDTNVWDCIGGIA